MFAITRNLELGTRNLLFYAVSAVGLVEKTAVLEISNEPLDGVLPQKPAILNCSILDRSRRELLRKT